jgi:hypothetical protein
MRATRLSATDRPTLRKAQIGRCGELLVQYRLLKHGIESASMTTDAGIDLVAYAPRSREAVTVQVKANLQPKPRWWPRQNATVLGFTGDKSSPNGRARRSKYGASLALSRRGV